VGFPFTMDALVIPDQPGPLELLVAVDYTDDFNQLQTLTQTVTVEVIEGGSVEPPIDGGIDGDGTEPPPPVVPESFWDKVVRFLKGLLGLDSGVPTPGGPSGPIEVPPIDVPGVQPPKG
jgi:hypothetical protein